MSQKKFHLFSVQGRNSGKKGANFFAWEENSMTSVDSNFNFLCGRPHAAGPPPPVHMRPPEPDPLPPPCGRHKWMAPKQLHPGSQTYVDILVPTYFLWHNSYKMNNNFTIYT